MKKIAASLLLAGLMILLTACPYHSDVPISQPSVQIIPSLCGIWQTNDGLIKIKRKNEFEYDVITTDLSNNNAHYHHAYLSKVNEQLFVNVRDLDPDTKKPMGGFIFYKLLLPESDKIELYPITENVVKKFTSSESLFAYISENMKNSYFFENGHTLRKQKNNH